MQPLCYYLSGGFSTGVQRCSVGLLPEVQIADFAKKGYTQLTHLEDGRLELALEYRI